MREWGIITVLSFLSVAWLAPLWFAVSCLITWAEHEELGAHGQHSFPYLSTARIAIAIAGIWLAVIIVFWVVIVSRIVVNKKTTTLT